MGAEITEILRETLTEEWIRLVRAGPRIVVALVVLGVFVLAGRALGRTTERLLPRGRLAATHVRFFRGLVVWAAAFAGTLVSLNLLGWTGPAAGLLAGGGITAIALGFAFRGIGENLLAGLFLAFSRPFRLGDVIASGEFQGEVRGIELRYTHVRTADGRDVFVPSSKIFNEPLVNFTRDGLRRTSFVIGIDYGDDAAGAMRALLNAVRGTDGVLKEPKPVVSISAMTASYVELQASFWVDVFRKERTLAAVRTEVMEASRRALRDGGFTFSAEVSTAISLSGSGPLDVAVRDGTGDAPRG